MLQRTHEESILRCGRLYEVCSAVVLDTVVIFCAPRPRCREGGLLCQMGQIRYVAVISSFHSVRGRQDMMVDSLGMVFESRCFECTTAQSFQIYSKCDYISTYRGAIFEYGYSYVWLRCLAIIVIYFVKLLLHGLRIQKSPALLSRRIMSNVIFTLYTKVAPFMHF